MKEVISNIMKGSQVTETFDYVMNHLYNNGPVGGTDMEILSYLALYQPDEFAIRLENILNFMGVFYKDTNRNSLKEVIFGQYKKYIRDTYNEYYTPVQADIVKNISNSNCFSFSAPTSTGKSFVFINLIKQSSKDAIVVVPSRALINEYYLKLSKLIPDKSINILTFIDKINTIKANRNIFIVTPERCRDLFKLKDSFDIDLFLFDEAQLSNENSTRGLFYDSIVRRCYKAYPEAKLVFAHPFISNPEAQIEKNHLNFDTVISKLYEQKNVGQMYLCVDKNNTFYHFGIDKEIMGINKVQCNFDPIEQCIRAGGSILFYVPKAKIYNKSFLNEYGRYIDLCEDIDDAKITSYIDALKSFTGGDTIANKDHYSQTISLLKRGIVTHHGSLPLQSRSIIEQYTRDGFCKLCFATSTLEQGINMPFDIVMIDKFEASKPLEIKNLIGRAGRSSNLIKFDYGYVIISITNMSKFRKIIKSSNMLDYISTLDKQDENSDYVDFKEAIVNDEFSDQFNLTNNDLKKLSENDSETVIKKILNSFYREVEIIKFEDINNDKNAIYNYFEKLYKLYLGRELFIGEENVLHTAVKIMLWRVYGKTFKEICWYRYSSVSCAKDRKKLEKLGKKTDVIEADFITGYHDLPYKDLKAYSLFEKGTKAKDVDYDRIIYDTYDYIDKLIGFKLSDIFYAAFYMYYEKTNDKRALSIAKYVKYGTDNERYIWMIRYGMSFEDIEVLNEHIKSINEKEIIFFQSVNTVPDDKKQAIIRYL